MSQAARPNTLVARTAQALTELSLAHAEGDFLGAEDDLLGQFGVSRPTLRQAAKIAENDRLIAVRRGIRGGFYATRPDISDAVRTLAQYLRLQGTRLLDVLAISRLVLAEAAAQACACHDHDLRHQLADHLATLDREIPVSVAEAIASETEFTQIVAAMSGNPAITVVMAIGFSFGMQEQRSRLFDDPANRDESRQMQRQLCRAILDRDSEIARLMMRRRADMFVGWLTEHPAGDHGND